MGNSVKSNRGGVLDDYNNQTISPSENQNNLSKAESIEDLLSNCPVNQTICNNLIKAYAKINNPKYKNIVCSVSGGSDSDVMLDICWKCDKDNKIEYIWFDTGLEYQATKDHLKYLEEKYGIEIKPYKAIKPIPLSCKQYGQPFISKQVSEMIQRLKRHNFQWEDEPFDVLLKRYCKWNDKKQDWVGCKMALQWWCNEFENEEGTGRISKFNIAYNKWLKEFMVANPPTFKISNRCCDYAKKNVAHKLLKENNYDLNCVGIRKSESGARSTAYKSCFDEQGKGYDNYRPLFWYKDSDKEEYDKHNEVVHSRCYTEYGLSRTGCAGCPFGRDFEEELKVIEKYEPKLFVAVNNIFGDSYEYTRRYKEFCKMKNDDEKS